ncbi:hypothetical protein D3C86_2142440 [compost metagenome]
MNNEEIYYESSVPLLPLYGEKLCTIASQSGFSNVKLYGGFREEAYEPLKSGSVVIVAN